MPFCLPLRANLPRDSCRLEQLVNGEALLADTGVDNQGFLVVNCHQDNKVPARSHRVLMVPAVFHTHRNHSAFLQLLVHILYPEQSGFLDWSALGVVTNQVVQQDMNTTDAGGHPNVRISILQLGDILLLDVFRQHFQCLLQSRGWCVERFGNLFKLPGPIASLHHHVSQSQYRSTDAVEVQKVFGHKDQTAGTLHGIGGAEGQVLPLGIGRQVGSIRNMSGYVGSLRPRFHLMFHGFLPVLTDGLLDYSPTFVLFLWNNTGYQVDRFSHRFSPFLFYSRKMRF